MASDQSLLERCLRELEQPSGDAQALVTALRERLNRPEPAAIAVEGSRPSGQADAAGRPGEPGRPPIEGANTLWETNLPVRDDEPKPDPHRG